MKVTLHCTEDIEETMLAIVSFFITKENSQISFDTYKNDVVIKSSLEDIKELLSSICTKEEMLNIVKNYSDLDVADIYDYFEI